MPAEARDADVRDPEAAREGAHDREDPLRSAELAERIRPGFPDVLLARGEVAIVVERDELIDAIVRLRDQPDLSFGFLASLTATDHPGVDPRFWVVYELRSVEHAHRLRVKVGLPGEDPRIPSVTAIYPTADWHERETFDLYGIVFDGHPDLERILMPGDWEGYPLRKDEELGGVDTRYHGAFIPPVDERTNP